MRAFRTYGIVLKRRNFGETDRIVTVLTKSYGKIQIKATGVRKITSRRSSHIELLNYSLFSLYKGKMLPVLTEIDTLCTFATLKSELARIGVGYYVCEVIDGLCPENQEVPGVFSLLLSTLQKLEQGEDARNLIARFESELLALLGFYPAGAHALVNHTEYIESILEKKLKTPKIFQKFI